uniref:Putative cytidylyltransferase n=1 Tax=viral metagenome TaxID=1070528 RepID=A0A6M3L4K4_9ZZZZ
MIGCPNRFSKALGHNIIAYIPARGGSKGVPLKNIKEIAGQPLVMWTANAAAECVFINRVYIATDSMEIAGRLANIVKNPKIAVISTKEMDDFCFQETPMLEFTKTREFSHIILIQATSPLLTSEDLTLGIVKCFDEGRDSVISVVRKHQFSWTMINGKAHPIDYIPEFRMRRTDWEGRYVENGAFYITSKEAFLRSGARMSGNIGLYEMPQETYYEIDSLQDFMVVEQLLKERINGENI